jgi:cobalt-zinc-cadmium efflux system outer membrane protein
MESLQQAILPQAKEALALSQQGFSEGRFSYLDLLDAQRTFVEVRKEAIETALSYHQLLLGIERLIGQPLDATGTQP